MPKWMNTHKRNMKRRLKKLAKERPTVWKRHGFGDWGVSGYTKEGHKFYGSYESREIADLAADLIQLDKG